ncbi:hypothetical protein F210042A8_16160 [Blautia parvula]
MGKFDGIRFSSYAYSNIFGIRIQVFISKQSVNFEKKKKTGEKQLNIGEKEFIIIHSTKKGGNYHDNFQRYDNRRITPCG